MNLHKRTLLIILTSMLCTTLFSATLYANESPRRHYLRKRPRRGHVKKQDQCFPKEVLPEAGLDVPGRVDFSISADYIYWRMNTLTSSVGNGSGITTGTLGSASIHDSAVQGVSWQPIHEWGSGFKVAANIDMPHDDWDVRVEYIWNKFNPVSTFNVSYHDGTNSLNAAGRLAQLYNQAEIDFQYNKINAEVGRNFKLSPRLTLRPHAGLTGTWQKLDIDLDQNAGTFADTGNSDTDRGNLRAFGFPGSIHADEITKTWGLGIRSGLNFFWMLSKEIGIYSNVITNAIWVDQEVTTKGSVYNASTDEEFSGTTTVFANTYSDTNAIIWVAEFETGFRYQALFADDNYGFTCQIGWEAQNWINWTQGNDLTFQGLNVKFRFDF